jgi:hypothetical protein
MKSNKFFAAALAATFAASTIITPAFADSSKPKEQDGSILPALAAPIGIAAAIGSTTTVHAWSTVHTQVWSYPFTNTRNVFSLIGPNGGVTQGVHATGQYVHNVINPHYFNETLYIDPNIVTKPATGTHQTTAQYKVKHTAKETGHSAQGQFVVGCIMGSAFGAITAAIRKGNAMGNPLRWRSQAEHEAIVKSGYEKQFELTNAEAATALALCGLGSLTLYWPQQAAPAVVTARN